MFETIIDITPEIKDKIDEIASLIAKKDNTFTYKVEEDSLTIFSSNRDQAIKRGLWWYYKVSDKVGKRLNFNVFKAKE